MSRKLATIRCISDIRPIDGADMIELCKVDSWSVVTRKGEFTVGTLAIYYEIDTWMPEELAPFLIKKEGPKTFNDIKGEKLKTIKLKGQISQGLLMTVADAIKVRPDLANVTIEEGLDVTDLLGLVKWEMPSSMASYMTKGLFPSFLSKTDQERIQNLTKKFDQIIKTKWEVTEKYDGSSMTVYVRNVKDLRSDSSLKDVKDIYVYDEGVCSRNLDLKKESDENGTVNSFWEIAIREKLIEKIKESGLNIALQGELVGSKIGPNIYKCTGRNFYLFDIYDIDTGHYFDPERRQKFAEKYCIQHVPVLYNDYEISMDIDGLLKFAEGKSILNKGTEREGLVFKSMKHTIDSVHSFKAISNKYLMKTDG